MKNHLIYLCKKFESAIQAAFPELGNLTGVVEVVRSTQELYGHYQCNSAMRLTKPLRKNPRVIAEEIIQHVERDGEDGQVMISDLEIAGPGFINITLDRHYIEHALDVIFQDEHLGISQPDHSQNVVIDFSSPNTAKEMHVGHLRSTIIGDSLARLFEFLGHNVIRLNHVGDWGTAFGMLIAHMKDRVPEVLLGDQETDLTHLVSWYKESKKRFDEDPDFKKRSQMEVVALQGGDPAARKAWEIICEISRKAYQEIYDLLDIKLTERGESYYNPLLPGVVADLEEKGLVEVSNGAKCIFLKGFINRDGDPLPLMVQKTDGGYNYDTTDMAAIRQRVEDEKADRIIYVTDAGQANHFRMVFQAAAKAGYYDSSKVTVEHVPFGMVLGGDGKKFRTRSGETEKLMDLLMAAVKRAQEILVERENALPEKEQAELAHTLGIGAIKYADLSCNRTSDYTFSYDRMLRFEGNTAAFLMYAYVRVLGIKRKVGLENIAEGVKGSVQLAHPSELALGLHLSRFGEVLDRMAEELLPNKLTDYLYELADKFNAFFRDCRVEGVEEQDSRLMLCELVARTMRQGLDLLGVKVPSQM